MVFFRSVVYNRGEQLLDTCHNFLDLEAGRKKIPVRAADSFNVMPNHAVLYWFIFLIETAFFTTS